MGRKKRLTPTKGALCGTPIAFWLAVEQTSTPHASWRKRSPPVAHAVSACLAPVDDAGGPPPAAPERIAKTRAALAVHEPNLDPEAAAWIDVLVGRDALALHHPLDR